MLRLLFICTLLLFTSGIPAQSVQPVIVEYKGHADGKFAVTNDTLTPMVIVIEPRSFSITPEGKGLFRPLDSGIHIQLSAMNVRLQPRQTYYFFYKASAEHLPAWFTLYATFSAVGHSSGLDVRMMLPHTVYLYQHDPILREEVRISDPVFSSKTGKLTCIMQNEGSALARVHEVRASASHDSVDISGFPLLPGASRYVELDWKYSKPPSVLLFHFPEFDMRKQVLVQDQ